MILSDSAGNTGVGEVPGGEPIRKTLEDARALVLGLGVRNDAVAMQYFIPGWKFDNKRPQHRATNLGSGLEMSVLYRW